MLAVAAVVVLLAAQFITYDFEPVHLTASFGRGDGFEPAIGGYFDVAFPSDWPPEERYDFIWNQLQYDGKQYPIATLSFS